jgi:photosystem II stability/assembly factor-like uncharacterized protein
MKKRIFLLGIFFVFSALLFPSITNASMLTPGNITTCGELGIPGEYTLQNDLTTSGTSTCFYISSDNITINGNGHSITGAGTSTGSIAIDARARVSGPESELDEAQNGYTNLIISNLTIAGFTTGVNTSGNSNTTGSSVRNGNGGDGGELAIYYSILGSIITTGGNSSTTPAGGVGGNVYITDTNLNIANATFDLRGGTGTTARNTDGGLDLNYTGTLTKTNVSFSPLSFLNDNDTTYSSYPGGTWPITNTSVSSCGTLYATATTTFTLTQNITNASGTCFTIASNNITLDEAGYTVNAQDASTTAFLIDITKYPYSNFTLASTTVTNYSNLINSSSSVTISGNNLDISGKYIGAGSLNITFTGVFNYVSTTLSDLTNLNVNGDNLGLVSSGLFSGVFRNWTQKTSDTARSWTPITSDASGTKLAAGVWGGHIYTSIDSGHTWVQKTSGVTRYWRSITSSADGTKLAAVVAGGGGYIYTSTTSGETWITQVNSGSRVWASITSDTSGAKLAAAVSNGYIYTSTDFGNTWVQKTSDTTRSWYSIASSADGTKLAAVVYNGYIYTSTDSGNTWIQKTFDAARDWISLTSSANGTKLAAVVNGGYIYTSTDSGHTWVQKTSGVTRYWRSITSSADGTKLAAVVQGGYTYTSTDSGNTWIQEVSDTTRDWYSITSSADGTKLAAVVYGGYIYTVQAPFPEFKIDILTPSASSTVIYWNPYISWGTAVSCEYSYDNTTWAPSTCSNNGSDIPKPSSHGISTLYVRGTDVNNVTVSESSTFSYSLGVFILAPSGVINAWLPSVNWNPASIATSTLSCYYSYDNFVSTSTANCANGGTDIVASSTAEGNYTLYVKVIDTGGNTAMSSVVFSIGSAMVQKTSDATRSWYSITSSADGTKLAAVVNGGYIYTSIDSGNTWVQRTSDTTRNWQFITSDASGTKLAAVVQNGYIYTSTDSGNTWVQKTSDATRTWVSITSDASGTKLAAVVSSGYIYTSTDSGNNWVQKTTDATRSWNSITSSADGTKLAAVAGYIYTSVSPNPELKVDILTPSASSSITYWNPYVSWGSAILCEYSYDNITWTTSSCASNGSDISKPPSLGTSTLYVRGTDVNNITVSAVSTFQFNFAVFIIAPAGIVNTWSPSVNWNPIGTGTSSLSCYYSYNNFTSTSTANCANGGADIAASSTPEGNFILYVKVVDGGGNVATSSIAFSIISAVVQETTDAARSWYSVTSDASGTKLAAVVYSGYIYTSTDSGNTWVQKTSDVGRNWRSITSSADGSKLAAVVSGGYIYTSTDSGNTWVQNSTDALNWYSITSSSDGTKLAAVVGGGYIHTSSDSGNTWVQKTFDAARDWTSITSDASGTKLAATVLSSGHIYASIDSGNTWTQKTSGATRSWYSVTSDASGTKLAAVVYSGYIYTSTDSGNTWATSTSSGSRLWYSITSSADGTKLAAVASGGYVYVSADSGNTWIQATSDATRDWRSITFSADGTKLAAVVNGGYIYTSTSLNTELKINILTPSASSTVIYWNPYISWGTAVSCEYSYDNTTWASSTCSNNGSDIPKPSSLGISTLYVRGTDVNNVAVNATSTFSYNLGVFILAPSGVINAWLPSVNWNPVNIATSTLSCYYSYDNFVSTSTANCANGGTDIVASSTAEGSYILYVKVVDEGGNVATSSIAFSISYWVQKTSDVGFNRYSIISDASGTKLATVVSGGYVYVSTNSGTTWVQKISDTTRSWRSITSSADGTKLAAVGQNTYVYTSIDSGVTWVQKTFDTTRNWQSITSSADGTKLAAVATSGYIYTSTDSGNTWVQKTTDATRSWNSITSSADGTKLAAVVAGGYIYTSTDSGNTWVQKTSDATRSWKSIASDASGKKLAAVVAGGYIYTSIDSGNTWVQKTSDATRVWNSITSDASGTKLAAVVAGGYIYTSIDSGNTWAQKTSDTTRDWRSITSSADGTKLAAVVSSGHVYTYTSMVPELKIDILTPTASSTIVSFSPYISWGTSVSCEYSYDNVIWASSTCANYGMDIPKPSSFGTSTLYVRGTDVNNTTVNATSTFSYNLGVFILAPSGPINTWSPSVNWNPSQIATSSLSCYYSYDNFVSTSTADCARGGVGHCRAIFRRKLYFICKGG